MKKKQIAVVLGIGSYNDLGVIRSCGEQGYYSVYITSNNNQVFPIYKSKYILKTIYIEFTANNILSTLKDIQTQYAQELFLFPCSDSAAVLLDEVNLQLPIGVHTSYANGRIDELMDKSTMAKMAKSCGLLIPYTAEVELDAPYDNQLNEHYPIILKPLKSIAGNKSDITICSNEDEFRHSCEVLKSKCYSSILVQDYIKNEHSREIGITGIAYNDGTVEVHGYIDKIRNRGNINNFGKYYPCSDNLVQNALIDYIKSTGYKGIFDTDFILFDNKMYFIECNFRNGAYGYAVTASGFNMPVRWIESNLHGAVTNLNELREITFMEERTDLLNVLDGTMSLSAWMKDVFNTNTFLFWNRKDIRPMLRIPYFVKKYFRK